MIERGAPVALVGAGTMGAGIAQVAAVAGHPVIVYDAAEGAAARAVAAVRDRVARLVQKGRLEGPVDLRLEVAGDLVYFCCDGCRDRYAAEHAEDLAAQRS